MAIILTPFMLVASLFLMAIHQVLSLIEWSLPQQAKDAMTWAFGFINYFRGIFDVENLLLAFVFVFFSWALIYGVKILFEIIVPFLPFVGDKVKLPEHDEVSEAHKSFFS